MDKEFFKVDNKIFDFKLRPITFLVYCYLLKCNNAKNGCFPSKATIAKNCNIALSSVDKALIELQSERLVEVEHRFSSGHQQTNLYKLRDVKNLWWSESRYKEPEPSSDYELPL